MNMVTPNKNDIDVIDQESQQFIEEFERSLSGLELDQGSIIKGKIIDIKDDYLVVDAGLKSESIVPMYEFVLDAENEKIEIGQEYDLFLEAAENGYGETCLSRDKARKAVEWQVVQKAYDSGDSIVAEIVERVKGGFSIVSGSVRGFLPGSQVDVRPVRFQESLVGQQMEFKIVKLDQKRNNIVVSRRAILEEQGSEDRIKVIESLEVAKVITGTVKNLTDYGAFIDLGGIDGLLHITDMSWKRIKHPSDLVKIGEEIEVKILSYDKEKSRVSLGLKQLQEDPWEDLEDSFPLNSKVFGVVTNMTEYGCFVEITNAIEGLVHMSEMDWTNKNVSPSKVVKVGDEVEVMVLDIDKNKRRISLGIKQCLPNPWDEFTNNNKPGDKVQGQIRTITDFGVFIGLDGGIDGLIHATDLSWTESGEKIIRNMKKNEEIEAVVLTCDPARERISLGVKQLTSDPFADFCEENPKGTKISTTVQSKDSKYVYVKVNDKIEGIVKVEELGSTQVNEGDTLELYVTLHESRNYYLPLSKKRGSLDDASMHTTKHTPVETSSLGDMIKKKLSDSSGDN